MKWTPTQIHEWVASAITTGLIAKRLLCRELVDEHETCFGGHVANATSFIIWPCLLQPVTHPKKAIDKRRGPARVLRRAGPKAGA